MSRIDSSRHLPPILAALALAFGAAAMFSDGGDSSAVHAQSSVVGPGGRSELAAGAPLETHPDGERWQEGDYREVRAEFVLALSRIEAGADPMPASPALRAYPLYPYLEAAKIRERLERADAHPAEADDRAAQFLAAHADSPVGRDLRRAWLESLARREAWAAFVAQFEADGADLALQCRALNARVELDDIEGIAPRIIDIWLTGRQLPLECEPVFRWLRDEGPLTDDLIEQRTVLLLENGQPAFARIIADRLPPERAAPLLGWADLLEHPRRAIDELIASPQQDLPADAVFEAWQRLARNRPSAALARHVGLREALGLDDRAASRYALALALGLAWDRRPEALDVFADVDPADLSDYALGWLTRAALWSEEWQLAADAIMAMSADERDETRWRYWAARAAEQLGQRSRARELYRSVLDRDNYYAAMAAARLDEAAAPRYRPLDEDRDRMRRIAGQPAFVRARELLYANLRREAAAEWRHGYDALDAADRPQTIHVARRWGWYDMAVATATSHRVFNDYPLLYPRPYDEAVASASALTLLEPALIYGVIRQESLYRRDAASSAGAIGLAQLLPDTARRAARHWNRPVPSYADLFLPEVNVTLGAGELRRLIDEFGGQLAVGLAGYNAGPGAAERWLPEEPIDADIWIENIPYNETRRYVQRVLWHSLVFAWLETGEARSTEAWLAQVAPPGDVELELSADN